MITLKYDMRLLSKSNEKIQNRMGRYFLSKKFKDFDAAVKLLTRKQYKGKLIKHNIGMSITALYTNKIHPDAANLSKSICDSLQGEVYANDRQIKEIYIKVFEGEAKDAFIVEIDDKLMFAE